MKNIVQTIGILCSFLLCGCAAYQPYVKNQKAYTEPTPIPKSKIDYELYLVGDIGINSKDASSDIVDILKSQMTDDGIKKSVVFLGNSFNEDGFPETDEAKFSAIDKITKKCIKTFKNHTEKTFFIPGNKEWYDGHDYTVSAVQDVEDYIQSKVNGKNIFVPSNGCGKPKLVELTDDLLLVLIDSQWILQGDRSYERKRSGCDIDNEQEFITYLQEKLSKNKDKNVIIAAHHPVYSNGKTGGNYGLASHLLPLPGLGSLITGIKKTNGGPQKFGHPQYEAYRASIRLALSNYEGIIHVSAHDKNLQYHNQDDQHYVVAGSGAEVDFVRKGGTADFSIMQRGFSKITHTSDLELWLEFYVIDESNPSNPKSIYKKLLHKKEEIDFNNKNEYRNLNEYPETKTTVASNIYAKGFPGLGKTHRTEWGTEVTAPILLLDEIEGGLTPVQQGGGFQTKSLRLENPDGKQWVIRTINKDVDKLVPPALRNTLATDIVQDGISAAHPYGALVIPQLAEAAQIYHANPKLVWLPKQKALGDYNKTLANRLYLFEERPGGNMKGHPSYGGAEKSVNTPEFVEKLLKNHKHKVDQEMVLRSRLFDLLIGDWDRHGDQWRWGIYKDPDLPGIKVYRPIPRDRDQVFFKNDGLLNYIFSRPYLNPQLRKFDHKIDIIDGIAYNARHFDRQFISELNEEDFIKIAQEIQTNVTDRAISTAFEEWPKEIYDIRGAEIISKIKSRRSDLVHYAREFYRYLSQEVTVIGTNGKNIFEVETLDNDRLNVKAYHLEGEVKYLIWSRIIEGKDCNELRLYGLKKKDIFNFKGHHKSSIKVRLVGGSGEDIVHNESSTLNIRAYDRPKGIKTKGNKIKSKIKDQKGINRFDRLDWKYDRHIHFPLISFYTDEGIGLSYNYYWKKNGFRKNPYKSNNTLSIGHYFANAALVATYKGHWPSVFGPNWDLKFNALFNGPSFTQFYYGLGNTYVDYGEVLPDVEDAGSRTFHAVRGVHLDLNPLLVNDMGTNRYLSINPSVEYINMSDVPSDLAEEKFTFFPESGLTASDFTRKTYTGLGIRYESNRINNPSLPTKGYIFNVGADYKQSLSDSDFSNLTLDTELKAYIPFSPTHKVVLSTNIGGAYTIGDYEFFHANYLSNQSRLRGFRTNRFSGDGIIYQATDLRIKLIQGRGSFKTGFGLFGSFDYGRAFLEGEGSSDWHTSYGGGIYITPLNLVGFRLGYFAGEDDEQISIGGSLAF